MGNLLRRLRHGGQKGLIPLDAALDALGDGGSMGRRVADVPVAQIVGSVRRSGDFDEDFRPARHLPAARWQRLAGAMQAGTEPPPVDLIQLGDLYFVADGHHRVSVCRAMDRLMITARVLQICTVAYAMACLRLAHLPAKAAERQFLDRVPLPDAVREDLWLDEPGAWLRLGEVAEAWGYRQALLHGAPMDRFRLATRWWYDEVEPTLEHLRAGGVGLGLRDVELYVAALAVREKHGRADWSDDLTAELSRTVLRT